MTTSATASETKEDEDLAGFEVFFRETYFSVVSTACRVVGNREEAEEIASEAFARLFREPAAVQNRLAWLKRCAVRLSLDRLRAVRRRKRREEESSSSAVFDCPEARLHQIEECSKVRRILAELPTRDAEVLMARAEGYSYAEIASFWGLKAVSVGKLLIRAENNFRQRYEKRYGTE